MNILGVEIPSAVIKSARARQLVVFVGAGASYAPPANLPDFKGLTLKIAAGTGAKQLKDEPLDRFLGRLEKDHGVDVHQRANLSLGRSDSQPNPAHHAIVRLFPEDAPLRIVTTNFDMHLEGALEEQERKGVGVYRAPALPLGSDFDGIVYVHGRLEPKPEQMVLTDRDFGKAYLTEGYARRFLSQLFASFDVLFVGYSHDDPVVSYLARGLPPDSNRRRFALTEEGRDSHWRLLGIDPIEYPNPDGDHALFGQLLTQLGGLVGRGPAGHEQVLKRYIGQGVEDLKAEGRDYLLFVLDDPELRRLFFQHARGCEWLSWMEQVGQLEPLFENFCDDNHLIYWFLQDPFGPAGNVSLEVLSKRASSPFSRPLQIAIAQKIWWTIREINESEGETRELAPAESQRLMLWVSILASAQTLDPNAAQILGYLLKDLPCTTGTVPVLLFIFNTITRPYPQFQRRLYPIGTGKDSAEIRVAHSVDYYSINDAWDSTFRPHLNLVAEPMIPLLTERLMATSLILQGAGQANERFDALSFGRPAIDAHEQNHHNDVVDVLIDGARDCLAYLNKQDAAMARRVIENWIKAGSLLLRRLAIHGMLDNSSLTPRLKIDLIVATPNLLRDSYARRELMHTLRHCYVEGNDRLRRRILREKERALESRYAETGDRDEPPERLRLWKRSDWLTFLVWLEGETADCQILGEAIKSARDGYPDLEAKVVNPDFNMWSEARSVKSISPMSEEQLAALSPADLIDLQSEVGKGASAFDVDEATGLHEAVSRLAATNFDWGIKNANYLIDKELIENQLWAALFRGWGEGVYSGDEQSALLSLLADNELVRRRKVEVARLVCQRFQSRDAEVSHGVLGQAVELAAGIWSVLDGSYRVILNEAEIFTEAINNPLGWIGRFAISALSRQRNDLNKSLEETPELKRLFNRIVKDADSDRVLGAVALAADLPFLVAVAPVWTRKRLMPLLDWERNAETARYLWIGYFHSNSILPVVEPFLTYLCQTFGHLDSFEDRVRRQVPKYLVALLQSQDAPLQSRWLSSFLQLSADEDRALLWDSLRYRLESEAKEIEDEQSNPFDKTWEVWGESLVRQRLTGGPELEDGEWRAIVHFGPNLDKHFMGFIDLLERRSLPAGLKHMPRWLFRLSTGNQSGPVDHLWQYPEGLARYMLYLMDGEFPDYWCSEIREILLKLKRSGLQDTGLLARLKDRYVATCGSGDDLWED